MNTKEAGEILKKRGYVEHNMELWMKGFVKVQLLESSILVSLDHPINCNNGIRCFYEKGIFNEILMYFEYRTK